jgi:toxin ParE1/3/4
MRRVRLAESDLLEIWQYTFEQWDDDQADKYLDELDKGIALLEENANLGAKRDYVRDGYRVLFINRHAVYYIVTASTVHIVRILHSQMDPERHL